MIKSFEIGEFADTCIRNQIAFICLLETGKRKLIRAARIYKDMAQEEQLRMLERVINKNGKTEDQV